MKKYLKFIYVKKKFVIMTFILLIIIFVFISKYFKNNNFFVLNEEQSRFKEEYESLNDKVLSDGRTYPQVHLNSNKMKYISVDEVLDILDHGTGVIYIGCAECIYCRSAVQVLTDTAKDLELEVIYYLDISEIWNIKEFDEDGNVVSVMKAKEGYVELLNKLGEEYIEDYVLTNSLGENIETGDKRVKVPLVISVVNGNIVSSNVGTLFSQEDPFTLLDEDQIKGLSEIYQYQIKDVLEGLQNNSK